MEDRNWYSIAHLSGLLGALGPAVVWLIKHNAMPSLVPYIKSSLNFQIILFIAGLIISFISNLSGVFPFALGVFNIYHVIKATIQAGEGSNYKYPFSFEFIK
jgi:uncharacterized Tic20 family protein